MGFARGLLDVDTAKDLLAPHVGAPMPNASTSHASTRTAPFRTAPLRTAPFRGALPWIVLAWVVTALRFEGERRGWIANEAGGGASLLGVSWLIPIHGLWLGRALARDGLHAPRRARTTLAILLVAGVVALVGNATLLASLELPFTYNLAIGGVIWSVLALLAYRTWPDAGDGTLQDPPKPDADGTTPPRPREEPGAFPYDVVFARGGRVALVPRGHGDAFLEGLAAGQGAPTTWTEKIEGLAEAPVRGILTGHALLGSKAKRVAGVLGVRAEPEAVVVEPLEPPPEPKSKSKSKKKSKRRRKPRAKPKS